MILVSLPSERSLAALAVDELTRKGLRARIATRPPTALASRRALAGARAGGAHPRAPTGSSGRCSAWGGRTPAARSDPGSVGRLCRLCSAAASSSSSPRSCSRRSGARSPGRVGSSGPPIWRRSRPRAACATTCPGCSRPPACRAARRILATSRAVNTSTGRDSRRSMRRGGTASIRQGSRSSSPTPAPIRRFGLARRSAERSIRRLSPAEREDRGPASDPGRRVGRGRGLAARRAPGRGCRDGGGRRLLGPPRLSQRRGDAAGRRGGLRPDGRGRAAAGIALVVVSGFRSDAEQAELFERHPDPRWVAPPGRSLHRCATELDLGPSSAYGWLAANARRFGFVQRYSVGGLALRLRRRSAALLGGGKRRAPAGAPGGGAGRPGCRASSRAVPRADPSARRPGGTSRRACSPRS